MDLVFCWIEFFFSLWMCKCVVLKREYGWVIESGWWHSRRESGKERVGKKRKEGRRGKSGLREKNVFLPLRDCVFHTTLSVYHAATLLQTFSPTTHHTTPSHTTRHINGPMCCPHSLWVTVHALLPRSNKQHNTMQPCNHTPGTRPYRDIPHLSLRRWYGWHAVNWLLW